VLAIALIAWEGGKKKKKGERKVRWAEREFRSGSEGTRILFFFITLHVSGTHRKGRKGERESGARIARMAENRPGSFGLTIGFEAYRGGGGGKERGEKRKGAVFIHNGRAVDYAMKVIFNLEPRKKEGGEGRGRRAACLFYSRCLRR